MANTPSSGPDRTAQHLAANIQQLRSLRGLTQQKAARAAGIPRPTWSNLESGTANPTLAVLRRVGEALQVSIEELVAPPKSSTVLYSVDQLPTRGNALAMVRRIIPEALGGMQLERIELAPNSRFTGVPHKSGTREYLACELGTFNVHVSGEQWTLKPGEVLVFRGDQRHSYVNNQHERCVGYSLVMFG